MHGKAQRRPHRLKETHRDKEREWEEERERHTECVWVGVVLLCGASGLAACQTHWRVCLCKQEVLRCRRSVKTNTQTDRQADRGERGGCRGGSKQRCVCYVIYVVWTLNIYIYIDREREGEKERVYVLHGTAKPLAPFSPSTWLFLSTCLRCSFVLYSKMFAHMKFY